MTIKSMLLALPVAALLVSHVPAEARRTTVIHRGPRRTTVVVHRGFPLHRRFPAVVVHPVRSTVALITPVRFLPIVAWRAPIVVVPAHDLILWQDAETFTKDEDWTDFSLGVHERGSALYLEIEGRARIDFAEVVFADGDTQVVDFNQARVEKGNFELLNFRDGRKVSHVRVVAKAESEKARVVLRLEK